jgi:hypothetical protein
MAPAKPALEHARDFFARSKPALERGVFGGFADGPLE